MDKIIAYERPCALAVASMLGITLRTMQRNLMAWGTTFEELLTEFLMLHAAYQLRVEQHSVTDVAFDLGYSDSGHFTRAFKRWTGNTPRDFKASDPITVPDLQPKVLARDLLRLRPETNDAFQCPERGNRADSVRSSLCGPSGIGPGQIATGQ